MTRLYPEARIAALDMDKNDLVYGNSWYEEERDDFTSFRWLPTKGAVLIPREMTSAHKYVTLPVFSEFADFSQVLTVRLGEKTLAKLPLLKSWNFYTVPLNAPGPGDAGGRTEGPVVLTLSLNKLLPAKYHSGDSRSLGVRVGAPEFHNDDERRAMFLFFHKNAQLNRREMAEGKTRLESYPLSLGIDLYGKCNISPHCVYCLWDSMKELEGGNADVRVDKSTLEGYGPFFKAARSLINCSFGEPLLHPQFEEILDFCARNNKILELSTNGQAFNERTVQAMAGKPIYLYISLDAATKETYAKIRNDRWDTIIPGLRRLGEARKKAGGLPKINMVFIPMRVNRGDLEEYFKLCVIVGADSLVIRPMLFLVDARIEEDRGGYHFDYEREMLNRQEIEEVLRRCDEYSEKYGVPVANQFDFGLVKEPGKQAGGEKA